MKFRIFAIVVTGIALLIGPAFARRPPASVGHLLLMARRFRWRRPRNRRRRRSGIAQAWAPSGDRHRGAVWRFGLFRADGGQLIRPYPSRPAQGPDLPRGSAPSQAFQDRVQANNFLLGLEGMMPVGGGFPIVSGGKIVGAIGVAGAPISAPG